MREWTVQDWIIIIPVIATAIVTIINAWKNAADNAEKLKKLKALQAGLDENTTITKHNCDANSLAISAAHLAAQNAAVAATTSAATGARVEAVVKRLENGSTPPTS
jgi:hypothetical protein